MKKIIKFWMDGWMDVSIFHQQLKVSRETKVINWYLANLSIRETAFFMELCVCICVFFCTF